MLTHVPVKLVKGYQRYQIHSSATIVVSPLLPFDFFGQGAFQQFYNTFTEQLITTLC